MSLGAEVRAGSIAPLDLRPWLDLVALGTIADVAPLDGDNRGRARGPGVAGLGEARPGVLALRELAKIQPGAAGLPNARCWEVEASHRRESFQQLMQGNDLITAGADAFDNFGQRFHGFPAVAAAIVQQDDVAAANIVECAGRQVSQHIG